MEREILLKNLVCSLDKHKAADIKILRVTEVSSLADYFVIAGGTSSTQVRALADYVEFELGEQGVNPLRIEGYQTAQWTLLDYGSVVVHIFQENTRSFYDLERLWQDAEEVELSTFLDNGDDNHEKV